MMSKRTTCVPFFIVILFLSWGEFAASQDGFFFTIPKVLREGDRYEFCLTTYSSGGKSREVTMSLINKVDPDINVKIDDVYKSGEQKCNNFTVPGAEAYELLLYNNSDILHDSVELTVLPHSQITLIQTDKPMYKPGQKVKFRVLTIRNDQRPRTGTIGGIYVTDPNGSRVKQFLNIDSKGIASLEFQLSKETKLGLWQIFVFLNETSIQGEEDGMVSFEVKEYVLPRFEVTITPPSYILAIDELVQGSVCARYTYGKDVRGFLELDVCGNVQYGYSEDNNDCHHEVVEMNGCYNFTANITHGDVPMFGWQLKIDASIMETGTGSVVNASSLGPSLTQEMVKLTLKDYTNGYFKPSLPFHGQVIVTRPDGTPAHNEIIRVTAFDYDASVRFAANFTSDSAGIVNYSLCGDFGNNITSLSIMAEALNYKNPAVGMYSSRANSVIRQWFSPSFSYVQIPKMEADIKCGEKLALKVPFTTQANSNTEFKYQVIARGKIVTSGTINHEHKAEQTDNLPGKSCLMPETFPSISPPTDIHPVIDYFPVPPPVFEEPPPRLPIEEVVTIISLPTDKDESEEEIPPPRPPPPVDELEMIDTSSRQLPLIGPLPLRGNGPPPPPFLPPSSIFEPSAASPQFKEPIVRSQILSDSVSHFMLEIPVTSIMAPKFTLLVHHVRQDGEIVADSMEFNVEPCFDNEVTMRFDRSTVLPGENVNLRLEASPGSVCGLGIVDKSVNILGGDHQITLKSIFDKIEALTISQSYSNSYASERAYCEDRLSKVIEEDHYWDISSEYVDAKQAFKSSGMIVLTDLKLETRPCGVSQPYAYDFVARGPVGPVGLGIPAPRSEIAVSINENPPLPKPVEVRSHFPETWLWDLQVVDENGTLDLPQVAPHTITSWVGNAMCMNEETGVGISPMETLTTFQPFFIHLNLPYSAVKGERLPIMFTIHNYLDKCLHMKIKLDMGNAFKVHNEFQFKNSFCVCPGNSFTANFYATPLEMGSLPITAMAKIVPGACNNSVDVDLTYVGLSDAVKRQMLVKAEGVTKEYTHTLYMCTKGIETALEDVILPMPTEIVKNSERGDIKVIGDIMGPALTNLDSLVRMPTGCGEQNMVGFTPNIFVLKYLGNTGLLTEEINDEAIKFMEIGYQRELSYRHKDGSFSAFGERDERGSVWLTAFVVKSFAQATSYIYIDRDDIQQSVRFLRLSQSENGCYRETGKVFSSYMMGGLGKRKSEAALTSYVLIALLQAGVNSTEDVIVEGFKCIGREFKRAKGRMDVYSLALAAYVHVLHDPYSHESIEIMKMLESKAKQDGSLKYWTREGVKPPPTNSWFYSSAPSAEVEMTAYALMAYLVYYGEDAIPHSHEIAMWLSQQRNPHGGFASTQDTVVGLNALSEFAIMVYDDNPTDVNISISGMDIENEFSVSQTENTKLLLQKTEITKLPNRIRFSARGKGCALVQANVRYNKLPQNLGSSKAGFHLKVMPRRYRHDEDRCDKRTINIAVGSRGNQKHSKGMSLVVVKLVTSWTPIPESLLKLKSLFPVHGMRRYEYDETENTITFYFDEFKRRPHEFTLDVEQDRQLAVSNPKAGQVSVINYYETDVAVIKAYTLKTICGTKEEISRKKKVIVFDPRVPVPVEQARIPIEPINIPPISERSEPLGPLLSPSDMVCPICRRVKSIPPGFKDIICNATFIYKSIAGRKGNYPLKLRQNIRTIKRTNVNKFTNFKMPTGCKCSLLDPPVTRVLIITSSKVEGKILSLDGTSAMTYSTRKMEKKIKKVIKTCPLPFNDAA